MIHFLQLSDLHLLPNPQQELNGINPQSTLTAVLESAQQQQPDFVILTGDIADTGALAAYQRLAHLLEILPCPVYWIAGNHDEIDEARLGLTGGRIRAEKLVQTENWQLILLDSRAPGLIDGFLGEVDFAHLKTSLAENPDKPTLVMLHHPPLPVGCEYMDQCRLINDQAFLATIDQYPQIRAVLFGHIHQEFAQTRNNVWFLGAPSTCVQFKPLQAQFAIDSALTPGYRWVKLHLQLETGIIRIH